MLQSRRQRIRCCPVAELVGLALDDLAHRVSIEAVRDAMMMSIAERDQIARVSDRSRQIDEIDLSLDPLLRNDVVHVTATVAWTQMPESAAHRSHGVTARALANRSRQLRSSAATMFCGSQPE